VEFNWQPREVPEVNTPYRRIKTKIPAPETVPVLERLRKAEPRATVSQPPIVWDRAEGFSIYDRAGNKWVDFTSGVLVANAGYKREKMYDAMLEQLDTGVWHTFLFANEPRARFVEKLKEAAPAGLDVVFLLTTGSESTEHAFKLMRTFGQGQGGKKKIGVVCFEAAFHGRTLGAQQIGGTPCLKEWIVNLDPDIHQAPFPDCHRCPVGKEGYDNCEEECFQHFLSFLEERLGGKDYQGRLAGVITESYQGGEARFMPKGYVERLAEWCRANKILLTFDEVQAGFGRTGKFFAFEHYGVVPDLICCGKGISGCLPLSAVIGRGEIMRQFPPGALTNTHSGNPISCAAALAHLELILEEDLVNKAQALEAVLQEEAEAIAKACPDIIWPIRTRGLVGAIGLVEPGTKNPVPALALAVVQRAVEKGLMLFAPVGPGSSTIKINPPLIITEEALRDGMTALREAIMECSAELL
jgi:4-aminobutyrate aminotransferase/(S)-3-amino-2-methylpropionate transaminase